MSSIALENKNFKTLIMITDNYANYDSYERDYIQDNQRDDQNQQTIGDENSFEEQRLSDNDYVDSEFSSALEQDDQDDLEQDYQQNDYEEENLENPEEDDEEYDENDWEEDDDEDDSENIEPETFTDDSLKID